MTGVAPDRHAALALAEKYRAPQPIAVSQELAESQLAPPELEDAELDLYGQLASALIYPRSTFRAPPEVLAQNKLGPNALWRQGISGDLPIALVRVLSASEGSINFELVKQLIQAHAYWHKQGLAADLIILIEETSAACQELIDRIESFIASRLQTQPLEKPGGIFIRHLGQLTPEEHLLFQAVARVVLTNRRAEPELSSVPLDEASRTLGAGVTSDPRILGRDKREVEGIATRAERSSPPNEQPLLFNNGVGGFTSDGREYVINLTPWSHYARSLG